MEKVWYAYLVNDSDFNRNVLVVKAFGTIDGEMKKRAAPCLCRNACCFCSKN
jgi:hypothetical protein